MNDVEMPGEVTVQEGTTRQRGLYGEVLESLERFVTGRSSDTGSTLLDAIHAYETGVPSDLRSEPGTPFYINYEGHQAVAKALTTWAAA